MDAEELSDLMTDIQSGKYDAGIKAIAAAVDARLAMLNEPADGFQLRAMAYTAAAPPPTFKVGQKVRVRSDTNISPKYLKGHLATVQQVNRTTVTIRFDYPQGRFGTDPVKCPVTHLEAV